MLFSFPTDFSHLSLFVRQSGKLFFAFVMDRRTMMKSLAITVWGMMALPACSPEGEVVSESLVKSLPLSPQQKLNLEKLVDTFLPESGTKGAVSLNVHHFLDKLLANCFPEDQQTFFVKGLAILENKAEQIYASSFSSLGTLEREAVLGEIDDEDFPEEKQFFDFAKEQTILAYTSSEYFLTNFTNYEMIPGNYDGCVDVPEIPYKI
jgi:hypothetical protein